MKKGLIIVVLVIAVLSVLPAQSAFDMDIEVEYSTDTDEAGETVKTIGLGVSPDFSVGKWGLSLYLPLRFKLDSTDTLSFYYQDWVPSFEEDSNLFKKASAVADLYLPLFRYVRYGQKSEPIYIQWGLMDDVVLGTGIFVNHYDNTALGDDYRQFGMEADIDGKLFNFPYVGIESFTNNLATFRLSGVRAYVRPFAMTGIPVIKDIEVGGSYVQDIEPDAYDMYGSTQEEAAVYFTPDSTIYMTGADVLMPVINADLFGMDIYGDYAFQYNKKDSGGQAFRAGLRGDAIGLISYQVDITLPINEGFYPEYFNQDYDIDPSISCNNSLEEGQYFLHGKGGFSVIDDKVALNIDLQAILEPEESVLFAEPTLVADLKLGEGIIPNFYFDAIYTKNNIDGTDTSSFFKSIITVNKDSELEALIHIKYGVMKITTGYTVSFDENGTMSSSGFKLGGAFAVL